MKKAESIEFIKEWNKIIVLEFKLESSCKWLYDILTVTEQEIEQVQQYIEAQLKKWKDLNMLTSFKSEIWEEIDFDSILKYIKHKFLIKIVSKRNWIKYNTKKTEFEEILKKSSTYRTMELMIWI